MHSAPKKDEPPKNDAPDKALAAVLVKSTSPISSMKCEGYDFHDGINYEAMMKSFLTTGFQATNFGKACNEVNRMLSWRLSQEPVTEEDEDMTPQERENTKCTIFLGYTSNLISAGTRDTIRFLCKHHLVDAIVTSAGGVEEDIIKCLAPTFLGEFELDGSQLREKGLNRIGNLLVPNDNYCLFENFMSPLLTRMLREQEEQGMRWTPSKIVRRLGLEINNEDSVYYWCAKNNIPVFCPAITDGSIGDMIFFHSFNHPGLVVDLVEDIRAINLMAMKAKKSGILILGGGVIKHHICNANLMRNGADFAVYMSTAQEYDGSDAGARPEEAKSWGKIKPEASAVKVFGDCTLLFPLLVSQTFARRVYQTAAPCSSSLASPSNPTPTPTPHRP